MSRRFDGLMSDVQRACSERSIGRHHEGALPMMAPAARPAGTRLEQRGEIAGTARTVRTAGRATGAPGGTRRRRGRGAATATFVENALAKARHAAKATGLPAVADDAGLCVDAFGGQPGVDTAFYATRFGYAKGDVNNVRALLEQMAHIEQRGATLVSTLVALRGADDPEPLIAVGRLTGTIAREPRGRHGFGFDSVMFLPELGQTCAELEPAVKNGLSHRGRAARALVALMGECW